MIPPARFVLDTSTAMSWCFEDESDPYADSVLDALNDAGAIVPGLWVLEVANVLLVAERRGRIDRGQSEVFLTLLMELPIYVRDSVEIHHALDLLRLGGELNLSVYDSSFLLLARQTALPLATRDKRLAQAAAQARVPIFRP